MREYLVPAGASALAHLVLLFVTWPLGARPSLEEQSFGPRVEVVHVDADLARLLTDPSPPPAAPALRDVPIADESSPAPPWPDARPPVDPPAATSAARVRVPELEVGEPLAGPLERLPAFQPLVVSPASTASADASAATPTRPPETRDTPEPAHGQGGEPADLPALSDATHLLVRRSVIPYPERARRLGIEGTAVVGIEVADDGTVARTWLIRSSKNRLLDRAALDGLKKWRFDMAAVRRAGLGTKFRQDVQFRLR